MWRSRRPCSAWDRPRSWAPPRGEQWKGPTADPSPATLAVPPQVGRSRGRAPRPRARLVGPGSCASSKAGKRSTQAESNVRQAKVSASQADRGPAAHRAGARPREGRAAGLNLRRTPDCSVRTGDRQNERPAGRGAGPGPPPRAAPRPALARALRRGPRSAAPSTPAGSGAAPPRARARPTLGLGQPGRTCVQAAEAGEQIERGGEGARAEKSRLKAVRQRVSPTSTPGAAGGARAGAAGCAIPRREQRSTGHHEEGPARPMPHASGNEGEPPARGARQAGAPGPPASGL
jgi:hypothetical protein